MSYICVVANNNGAVASSDSRETTNNGVSFDNRQKVFVDKKQGLLWATCGLTVNEKKDYLRLIEFIMRDDTTALEEKIDYIIKGMTKALKEYQEDYGSHSSANIIIAKTKKRTKLFQIIITPFGVTKKELYAPIAFDGGSGKLLLEKMKLKDYCELDFEQLKKYATNRVAMAIDKDYEKSKNLHIAQTVGGRILKEGIKR